MTQVELISYLLVVEGEQEHSTAVEVVLVDL
jgi:hypothetical protein